MKRIVFAWEIGLNLGHLTRQRAVANHLHGLGYQVSFIVRDLSAAAQVLSGCGHGFVQAPVLPVQGAIGYPANFSELLLKQGYDDRHLLATTVETWIELFTSQQADLVVLEFAPTALLAARACGIPAVMLGMGFAIPPDIAPFPSIRPWEIIPEARLHEADDFVLRQINLVLTQRGGPPLGRVQELFSSVPSLLTTFPELDHYGARPGGIYVGKIAEVPDAINPPWPQGGKKRVLAYLRPSAPGFENILLALKHSDVSVLCFAPGISAEQLAQFSSPRLSIVTSPLAVDALLKEADLAIVSGANMMADALLAGVPLLLVPQVVEQALAGRRVQELGAGIIWEAPRTPESARQVLEIALTSQKMRQCAGSFALKYQNFLPDQALAAIGDVLVQAITPN